MAVDERYLGDVQAILAQRHANGADWWTTPDHKLMKGGAFTTLSSAMLLLELGMSPDEPPLQAVSALIWDAWREDGRFRVSPQGAIYPCHTINAANTLCHLGYAADARMQKTFAHLLETQHEGGGWRCNKFSFGHGPETDCANPGPTLTALDAFRYSAHLNREPALDRAVEFLLNHWTLRRPIGPCHYGIGTLFMQVEYPFGNYNLFHYVYVLSHYRVAREDERFREALGMLQAHLSGGQIVVERVNPKLTNFAFCKKGMPSELGTRRYRELLANLD